MKRVKRSREELRAIMCEQVNKLRDTADEMALMYNGCDDPLHPWGDLEEKQKHYTDWIGFANVVCRPLVESEDEAVIQKAMAMYRKECPHYIAVALVMALNRIERAEGDVVND